MEKHTSNKKKASNTSKKKASNTSSEVQLTKSTFDETIPLEKEEDISNEIRSEEKTGSILPQFERDIDSAVDKINEIRTIIKTERKTEKEEDLPMKNDANIVTESILNNFKNSICEPVRRSFSRSWVRSSIIEYYWEIDCIICKTEKEFFSAPFPETSLYKIKLSIDNNTSDVMKRTLRFYIITEREFKGICNVYVIRPSNWFSIECKSISGPISNMTLLLESNLESLQEYVDDSTLIMYFEIGVIHKYFTESIHIDVPSNTLALADESNSKQLINCKNENNTHIKFKVKEQSYSVSRKVLYATNSNYFKRICDSANLHEVEINEDPITFKEMVSFITFNTISDPFDYYLLQALLIMATKYDVQVLKRLCECNLICKINIQNVLDLIQLAFSCNATFLKKYSSLFIKLYLQEIVRTAEYQLLPEDVLAKISELLHDINIPLDVKLPYVDT